MRTIGKPYKTMVAKFRYFYLEKQFYQFYIPFYLQRQKGGGVASFRMINDSGHFLGIIGPGCGLWVECKHKSTPISILMLSKDGGGEAFGPTPHLMHYF